MTLLSVNVNKVATLRNARGGNVPSLLAAVQTILDAGARGITVHPRADERHITAQDVEAVAQLLAPLRDSIEYNIEGDPRPALLATACRLKPHQFTLVPVRPGEITSEAGWNPDTSTALVTAAITQLKAAGIRAAVFVEANLDAVRWAASVGADRIELYTEPFARACEQGATWAEASFAHFAEAAQLAHNLGLGINAGHDLDLKNLLLFRKLPHLDEVSIGHALMSRALFYGITTVVKEYLALLAT